MQKPTLKLRIFQDIHSKFKNPPWLGFLVLGFLIGLEEQYINFKTKVTVDDAIKNYKDATEEPDAKPTIKTHDRTRFIHKTFYIQERVKTKTKRR